MRKFCCFKTNLSRNAGKFMSVLKVFPFCPYRIIAIKK